MIVEIFDPLIQLSNLSVVTIINFPGNTYQEIKSGVEKICYNLEIEIIKIGINVNQNIVYVTIQNKDAETLMLNTHKTKYQRSILESSYESFSEKHPIPRNYLNLKINMEIRKKLLKNVMVKFDASKKQTIRYVLGQLMRNNDINSLGIIFGNNNTVANIHVRNYNADKLTKLIENSDLNDLVTYCILEVGDNFIPPDWFKEQLMKEILNSEAQENPTEKINHDHDDHQPILEINTEVFINNSFDESTVLEVNSEISLISDSQLSSIEKFTTLEPDVSLGKENNDNNNPTSLVTCRVGRVVQSYASRVRG